jgi:hypothetical protein
MASTAGDIILGALLNISSYSPGEPLTSQESSIGLGVLNDLLDSLSNDETFVYTQQETIFTWVAGQYQYAVGNYTGGTYAGSLTINTPTLTTTSLPAAVAVGATVTDLNGAIPSGTTVVSIVGTTVTMSANATFTTGPETITYTITGDIPMARPLRFRDGFTRANASNSNLDYTFQMVSFDRYKEELLKNVQGPWPYIAAYQPTFPLGQLYVYPAPGSNYTAHLFTDIILTEFALVSTPYSLPQGYSRALKKLLALELAPIYNKTVSADLRSQAKEAKDLIKGTNDTPVTTLRYDSALYTERADAGWIQHGGFN